MDQKQPGNLIDLIILSKICPFGTTLGPSQGALGTQSLVKNLLSCRALPSGPETSKNPYGLNPTFKNILFKVVTFCDYFGATLGPSKGPLGTRILKTFFIS